MHEKRTAEPSFFVHLIYLRLNSEMPPCITGRQFLCQGKHPSPLSQPNQCDRIKLILQENNLKQKQLASEIGVTESYISKLLKDPNIGLSQSLAVLIEEKYGYNTEWLLDGTEPKLKQVSKNKNLSELHQKAISQLEKLNDNQIKAVLAFINSLEEIEKSFSSDFEN